MFFHVKNGLCFERLSDGAVRIFKQESHILEVVWEERIDADSWASVVASVSAYGENSASFQAAEMLHQGKLEEQTSEKDH